ncbi:uncharacterized protein AKAW2_50087A [Aspergillus luchuensis]|uniref:Uncharacterized protein n=1 Tax=Aspergillus kawachii TaxID=1069201 RepID=A0A7R7WB86_ASPKA|nr:uncharacterized protein AKAW2_50087A [Aspergillus luchuensis]BCR99745.1 hypothetical protein AKAW2_50087A [Aspergillus luchuensis]
MWVYTITVDNILTAPWPVNETELACVVCLTLDGIRFLRDQGRALATLGPDTVWLNKRGQVRLAGVEQSYQIKTSDTNADTLKLTALATGMRSMMATGAGHGRWSSEAQTFLENLPVKSLDMLMKDPFLEKATDESDLKLCVHGANKQARHDLVLL